MPIPNYGANAAVIGIVGLTYPDGIIGPIAPTKGYCKFYGGVIVGFILLVGFPLSEGRTGSGCSSCGGYLLGF